MLIDSFMHFITLISTLYYGSLKSILSAILLKFNEWMDGWMNEWMNEWKNEWTNDKKLKFLILRVHIITGLNTVALTCGHHGEDEY